MTYQNRWRYTVCVAGSLFYNNWGGLGALLFLQDLDIQIIKEQPSELYLLLPKAWYLTKQSSSSSSLEINAK